jgi:hypothetical protein
MTKTTRWSLRMITRGDLAASLAWFFQSVPAPASESKVRYTIRAGFLLFHDKGRGLRNLLFRDCVIYFDRDFIFSWLKTRHRQSFLDSQLIAVRA